MTLLFLIIVQTLVLKEAAKLGPPEEFILLASGPNISEYHLLQ